MKLVIILGAPAVGKMTVGQALQKITGLKLFHNHMSLELVNQFFDFGTPPFSKLDKKIRFSIFDAVATSELSGLIFTLVMAYNYPEDFEYLNEIIAIFEKQNAQICLVELRADLQTRLERNVHEHRLKHKLSKNNLKVSEASLLSSEKEYRMIAHQDELKDKNIYSIDNSDLSPQDVALLIKEKFNL